MVSSDSSDSSSDAEDEDDDNDVVNNTCTMFPEMLASIVNIQTHFAQSILKKWLQKLLLLLPLQNLTTIEDSLLSLLPSLLLKTISCCPSLTTRSAQLIGAISLSSLEANERIASDEQILKALMASLANRSFKCVSIAVCNAVLDLSTTSIGRQRLCQVSAVEKLISVFLQDLIVPAMMYDNLCSMEKERTNIDEFPVLVLDATIALINDCDEEQLARIPTELCQIFSRYLKELWALVRDRTPSRTFSKCSKEEYYSLTSVRIHGLAESIFRLSINLSHLTSSCTSEVVKQYLFGPYQTDFENFFANYWEKSPILLRRHSESLQDDDNICSSFIRSFNCKRTPDIMLSSILGGLVSCPPLPADDLDILSFLKEVNYGLGCPIIYEQDIRILKTVDVRPNHKQDCMKMELHFLEENVSLDKMDDTNFRCIGEMQTCKKAYQEGYTIALRGMEFRSESVAAIADGLAILFGQPSVGANAYLTPPRSQGLRRHYDDHCVFVFQLLGQKQWTVFPRATSLLPRLYEPIDNLVTPDNLSNRPEGEQFLLEEGDILYIPRGCPHEACTTARMDDASTEFSLHLTLGIEVEPPFEWEGFAHVALDGWSQKQKPYAHIDSILGKLNVMAINLLHVSIQLIGRRDPILQRACMVASFSLPPGNKVNQLGEALNQNQRTMFRYVIDCVNKEARFLEAITNLEKAIQEKNEDLCQRMIWLKHLHKEGKEEERYWNSTLTEFKNLLSLTKGNRDAAEAAFMQVKSTFCEDVIFENVCQSFKIMLQKYKKIRKQYTTGMLSLHHT